MDHNYQAYMLRLWRVGGGESATWRASLEDPHNGELRGFASPEALMAFLGEITSCRAPANAASGNGIAPHGLPAVR